MILQVVAVTGLLLALGSSAVAVAASSAPAPLTPQQWRTDIQALPLPGPGTGCFTSSYPALTWTATPCAAAPNYPYIPKHGLPPANVGNGTDYSAVVSGTLSRSTGSFDFISAGATERGQRFGGGPLVPNTYSLQLDARPFTSPRCATALNPALCTGWQQFIYSSTFNRVFMQYWLLKYNRLACPGGWNLYVAGGNRDCWRNSAATPWTTVPTIPALANIQLTGAAGVADHVVMAGLARARAIGANSMLNLRAGWKGVEFAIVGDCCGVKAVFSPGTTIQVHTTTHSGTTLAPACTYGGYTGETNNLYLNSTPPILTQASPALVSVQSTTPASLLSPPSCATASGQGDTHLVTFSNDGTGLHYDFQSTGDYLLATTGPNFIVENRQVSGAPSWVNRAVNAGIATKVGPSVVAVCTLPPKRGGVPDVLMIDGRPVNLASGGQVSLPDGGSVSFGYTMQGNPLAPTPTYLISDGSGNSVVASVFSANPNYINVNVGVGSWPVSVHGLLANASNGNPLSIQASNGTILTAPWTFSQFYGLYSDGWRVSPQRSLLSACGGKVTYSDPTALAYASELSASVRAAAQKICVGAAVEAKWPLGDCEVDVAWLGPSAAGVYRNQPQPANIGLVLPPTKVPHKAR